MRIDRWITTLVLLLLVPNARAQTAFLRVDTNDPYAHVFADSSWLGRVAQGPFALPAARTVVRVVPSEAGVWGIPSLLFDVDPVAGDTVVLRASFPYLYRVESSPPARVVLDRIGGAEALGTTPVLYRSDGPAVGIFRIEREGFVPAIVEPGNDLWNLHAVQLSPLRDPTAESLGISVEQGRPGRRWIDYAAVGVAATAGILAIHYKRKADRRYDRYLQTGDPNLKPLVDRYDRYSALALGTMQVGVGVFAVRLALR